MSNETFDTDARDEDPNGEPVVIDPDPRIGKGGGVNVPDGVRPPEHEQG